MHIEHFGGLATASDLSSLDAILLSRHGDDLNEFWLHGRNRYPLLSVQVRGALACLHYFPHEGHPGFISRGDAEHGADVTFYTNTSVEEIVVTADHVVSWDDALSAAHQFFASPTLPSALAWDEL